jgi:hypothetical protein
MHAEIRYVVYLCVSLVSIAFSAFALQAIRDKDLSGGRMFLKAEEVVGLFPVLFWGVGVPVCSALSLLLIEFVFSIEWLAALAGLMFAGSFVALNYVVIRGSLIVWGRGK